MHNFYFGGHSLAEYAGRIAQAPNHKVAERDIEFISIPGRSGDFLQDNGRYKNVEFEMPVYFMPFLSQQTAKNLAYAVIDWLASSNGYCEYRDTYNPGYYTKAVLINIDEIVRELPTLLSTKLKFSRIPYWYRLDGKNQYQINTTSPIKLYNPEPFASAPVITLTGANATTSVKINDKTIIISVPNDCVRVEMDREIMQYIGYKSDGSIKYLGSSLPPMLNTGINTVKSNAPSNNLYITPNWRRL